MENAGYQRALAETTRMYEERIAELNQQLEDEHAHFDGIEEQLHSTKKLLNDNQNAVKVWFTISNRKIYIQHILLKFSY